jgi:hypothetical protein
MLAKLTRRHLKAGATKLSSPERTLQVRPTAKR